MRLHCRLADRELVRDLLVELALAHQRQHAPLLRRQVETRRRVSLGRACLRGQEDLAVQHRADGAGNGFQRRRFRDEGTGAELDGAAHRAGIAQGRQHGDRHGGMARAELAEAGEPVHARHVDIENGEIDRLVLHHRALRGGKIGSGVDAEAMKHRAQRLAQRVAHHRVVVGHHEGQVRGLGFLRHALEDTVPTAE